MSKLNEQERDNLDLILWGQYSGQNLELNLDVVVAYDGSVETLERLVSISIARGYVRFGPMYTQDTCLQQAMLQRVIRSDQ